MRYSLIKNVVHIVNPFNKYPYPVLYFCGLMRDTVLKLDINEIQKLMEENTKYCKRCYDLCMFYADKLKDVDKVIRLGDKIIHSTGVNKND